MPANNSLAVNSLLLLPAEYPPLKFEVIPKKVGRLTPKTPCDIELATNPETARFVKLVAGFFLRVRVDFVNLPVFRFLRAMLLRLHHPRY